MPAIKSDQLEASLRSGKIGSLYLFDGPENWLKTRAVAQIVEKLVPGEAKDFNLERFDGQTCSGADIVTAMQTLPFLGDRRVVIVSSAEELSAAEGRMIGESLEQLPSSTCLVFLYQGKANVREEIPARVLSHGVVVTFWTPFANQLPGWVTAEVQRRGKTIAYAAAAQLAESCSDLEQISNELDKLCLFVGTKKTIDAADLKLHGLPDEVGETRDLEEALWNRNLKEALSQGRLLSASGVRGEMIFPLCERVFRTLYLGAFYTRERKMSFMDVTDALGIRGKTQQSNLQMGLKAYRWEEIQQAFPKITQADLDLKTGTLASDVAVSLLLAGLCGAGSVLGQRG